MNALKIKKGPIILPLLLLAALLAGYTAMNFRGISAADSLSLGQQYLNEMDYGGAIAAFTKAIELDPTSREAHLGLARAYVGSENDELAQELLEEMVYTQDPDAEAAQELADLFEREGEIVPALQVVQTMIDATDEEAYYTRREELLASLAETPRLFAEGTDQQLVIQDGKVLSRGNNMLGQLGLDPAAVADSAAIPAGGLCRDASQGCLRGPYLLCDRYERLTLGGGRKPLGPDGRRVWDHRAAGRLGNADPCSRRSSGCRRNNRTRACPAGGWFPLERRSRDFAGAAEDTAVSNGCWNLLQSTACGSAHSRRRSLSKPCERSGTVEPDCPKRQKLPYLWRYPVLGNRG